MCIRDRGIPCPQQTEQCHRQRVGAALELAAHQRILCAHDLRKYLLQLGLSLIHIFQKAYFKE